MKKMIKAFRLNERNLTRWDGCRCGPGGSILAVPVLAYLFSYDEKTQFNIIDIKEKINKIKETIDNKIDLFFEENLTFLHAEAVESILKKFKIDKNGYRFNRISWSNYIS